VIQVEAASAASRRPAQVWFSGTDDDAVYEAMLPVDDPLDEDGDPVVMPAVRRDVLETIARDLEESPGNAKHVGIRVSWAGDVLVVSRTADDGGDPVDAFMPGPDGLYEVGRLAAVVGLSPWYEVEPPLPHGPIDAGMALDLLLRATRRHPTRDLILKRLDIDVLRTARARAPSDAIRDALDEEIAGRTHGQNVKLFLVFLHRLKRETPEGRAWDAGYLGDFVELEGREAILRAVPDAVERVVAVLRDERDPEARARLTAALGRLGLDVADDDGPA
jgi:hypothetical protein